MITKQKTEYKAAFNQWNIERFARRRDAEAWLKRMERNEAFNWVSFESGAGLWFHDEYIATARQNAIKQWFWHVNATTHGTETTQRKAMQAARLAIHRNILRLVLDTLGLEAEYEVSIGGYRVDCQLANGAIIELDGGMRIRGSGSHSGLTAGRELARRNWFTLHGYRVYHFTPEMLWQHPLQVMEFAA